MSACCNFLAVLHVLPALQTVCGRLHVQDTKLNVAQAVNQGMSKVLYLNTFVKNTYKTWWVHVWLQHFHHA